MSTAITSVQQAVDGLARRIADDLGYELVEVSVVTSGRRVIVRVVLDTRSGPDSVTLDDCTRFSRSLGRCLDEEDTIPSAYSLEVSSPGIDRPFDSLDRYRRNLGHSVELWLAEPVSLAEGRKGKRKDVRRLKGVLEEATAEQVVVRLPAGEALTVPLTNIRKATRAVVF